MNSANTAGAYLQPRTYVPPTKPPSLNQIDRQIGLRNGSTSALEFTRERLQQSKRSDVPRTVYARLEELTRESGHLRHEIQFYRQCFDILRRLRETAYDVYQQLFISHYLEHESTRMGELIIQLQRGLESSVREESNAEKSWKEFWGVRNEDKEMEGEMI